MVDVLTFTKTNLYMILVFLIGLNIFYIVSVNLDLFKREIRTRPDDILPEDYFDVIDPWGPISFVNEANSKGFDLSVCNWFTYERTVTTSTTKPNILRAITDFEDGFSHLSESQACIDDDQVVFRRAKHSCIGKGIADCIGKTGDIFNRDATELYNSPCTNFKPCPGTMGALSFNFNDTANRFMTFSRVFVSSLTFTELDNDPTTDFYTGEGNLFRTNSLLIPKENDVDKFYPLIRYEGRQNGNFKQNIKIVRYVYKGSYVQNDAGPYGEIYFRPNNLHLDVETNTTTSQIGDIIPQLQEGMADDYWFQIRGLYTQENKIRKIFQGDNKEETDSYCTASIVSNTPLVSIYKRGTEDTFSQNEILWIEGDNGEDDKFPVKVLSTFDFSIFFVLKKGGTPRKWLLIPPQKLNKFQVIPRNDRTSKMSIFNGPFTLEAQRFANERNANIERNEEGYLLSLDGRNSLNSPSIYEGLYPGNGDEKPDLTVAPGEKMLLRQIDTVEGNINDISLPSDVPGRLIWCRRLKVERYLNTKRRGDDGRELRYINNGGGPFQGLSYPNNTFENYVRSIGNTAGKLGETISPFYAVEFYIGSKKRDWDRGGPAFKEYIWASTYSFYLEEFPSLSYQPGDRFLDGEVVWEVINAKSVINAFSSSYFLNESDSGKPVTEVIETGETYDQIYQTPVRGKLVNVIFQNWDLGDSAFPSANFIIPNQGVDGAGGSGGEVDIVIRDGNIVSMTVRKGGSGYATQSSISVTVPWSTIKSIVPSAPDDQPDVTVTGLISDSTDTLYIYTAIPINENGETIFGSDTSEATAFGFNLKDSDILIENGKIVLQTGIENIINNGGSGYSVGWTLYIDQTDLGGNSTITGDRGPNKFYSLRVTGVSDEVIQVKTRNLIKPNQDQSLHYQQSSFYEYNFYEPIAGESAEYGESPQQIGFINDDNITDWITTGEEEQFRNYLFRGSTGGFTSTVGVYTLQFPRLNYSTGGNNRISSRENLEIGKYIPFSRFQTSNSQFNKGTTEIKNYNRAQFVPNALGNVNFSEDDLPTF